MTVNRLRPYDPVTSPTIYAPWIALAVLVIGFAFVTRARMSASSELSDLTKSTA